MGCSYFIQKTCRPLAQHVVLGNSEIKAKPEETNSSITCIKSENKLATVVVSLIYKGQSRKSKKFIF